MNLIPELALWAHGSSQNFEVTLASLGKWDGWWLGPEITWLLEGDN